MRDNLSYAQSDIQTALFQNHIEGLYGQGVFKKLEFQRYTRRRILADAEADESESGEDEDESESGGEDEDESESEEEEEDEDEE